MKRIDAYLFDDQRSCCEAYFPWNVRGCLEPDPVDLSILEDPCALDEDEVYWYEIYDESFLRANERRYYPSCMYIIKMCAMTSSLVSFYQNLTWNLG